MSRTTQEKFMESLEVLAAVYKVEVINDPQYTNTGIIRLERSTRFTSILSFRYDFQNGYASFKDLVPPFGDRAGEIPFVVPGELQDRVLAPIQAILATAAKEWGV